jgi:hypothetical protein
MMLVLVAYDVNTETQESAGCVGSPSCARISGNEYQTLVLNAGLMPRSGFRFEADC